MKQKLLDMLKTDHSTREKLQNEGILHDGYHPEMQKIHQENAEILMMILDKHGWPTIELVGPEGAAAAWTIMQHAIGSPQLMKRAINLIDRIDEKSGVTAADRARTIDRIRVFEGRRQLYGTNFDWDEQNLLSPTPIEDESNVDLRRSKMGLCPLHEAVRIMRERSEAEGVRPPKNPERKQQEFESWLRTTGWRS